MKNLRMVVADDHELVRAGIRTLLETFPGIEVVGESGDGQDTVRLVHQIQPDLVLMDIDMPGLNGVEAAMKIHKRHPDIAIIILSIYSDNVYVDQALRAGASGYLLKDSATEELDICIKAVRRGETYLSPRISDRLLENYLAGRKPASGIGDKLTSRQREVLQLIAEGKSTREIAQILNLSIKTVETHRSHIMYRLGINDIPGLVRYALKIGLVSDD
ncbi:MAG: response regulator transcription factor [Gammaproteobacteria bacterium]|nr:response regulator transcription factor [Gammaproteobacteria bacterium]